MRKNVVGQMTEEEEEEKEQEDEEEEFFIINIIPICCCHTVPAPIASSLLTQSAVCIVMETYALATNIETYKVVTVFGSPFFEETTSRVHRTYKLVRNYTTISHSVLFT